jgi:hypothetical protein
MPTRNHTEAMIFFIIGITFMREIFDGINRQEQARYDREFDIIVTNYE